MPSKRNNQSNRPPIYRSDKKTEFRGNKNQIRLQKSEGLKIKKTFENEQNQDIERVIDRMLKHHKVDKLAAATIENIEAMYHLLERQQPTKSYQDFNLPFWDYDCAAESNPDSETFSPLSNDTFVPINSGSGSKKSRVSLIILALLVIMNNTNSAKRLENDELFEILKELLKHAQQSAQKAGKAIHDAIEYSADFYTQNTAGQTISAASDILTNTGYKAAAATTLIASKSRKNGLTPIDLPKIALSYAVGVKGAEAATQTEQEFTDFWNNCVRGDLDKVKDKLLKLKNKPKMLKNLLIRVDLIHKFSPLDAAVNLGKDQVVKEILDVAKSDPHLLKELLMQVDKDGDSSLCIAANLGRDKVVKAILDVAKSDLLLLKELLIQVNKKGESPLYLAAYHGRDQIVKEILDVAKSDPLLLKEILMQVDKNRNSPLYTAAAQGEDKVVKEILDVAKSDPLLLKELLMQVSQNGRSTLYAAAHLGKDQIVKEILDISKSDPRFLRKLLMQVNQNGESPLYTAANNGRDKVVKEILDVAIEHGTDFFKVLVMQKPADQTQLSLLNHLAMSGDFRAIKMILKHCPEIELFPLPRAYHSNVKKTSIYYLESFLKFEENPDISYFQLQKNNKSKKLKPIGVEVDKIKPTSKYPILIELPQNRKVLLEKNFKLFENDTSEKEFVSQLKQTLKIANTQKINIIVAECGPNGHDANLKFSRNTKTAKWDVFLHDSNGNMFYTQSIMNLLNKIKEEDLADLGIIRGTKGQKDTIIPNYGDSFINGYCDMVASMVAASMIIGDDHSLNLKKECEEIGPSCAKHLGEKLNPEIDKILNRRVERIKEEVKQEEVKQEDIKREEIKSPSSEPKPTKEEKTLHRSSAHGQEF